jgi:hypothetical protein
VFHNLLKTPPLYKAASHSAAHLRSNL